MSISHKQPSITNLVIDYCKTQEQSYEVLVPDFLARQEKGIETYGTTLQPFNGRDALQDLYEELLDACQYTKQLCYESNNKQIFVYYFENLINLAYSCKKYMTDRGQNKMIIKKYVIVDLFSKPASFNDFRYREIPHLFRDSYTKQEAQYIVMRLNDCYDRDMFFIEKIDSPCESLQNDPWFTSEESYE